MEYSTIHEREVSIRSMYVLVVQFNSGFTLYINLVQTRSGLMLESKRARQSTNLTMNAIVTSCIYICGV